MSAGDRVHFMDNLRALAMLAGVGFHAALAYSPLMQPVWPAADAQSAAVVDMFAWFLHLFRMPLFFVVAGFFSARLLARDGMAGLFRNRCARVLLPLVLFAPPLLLAMGWLTEQAATTVAQPSPALAWIRDYVGEHGAMPASPGWAHLWFLFYLMLFTVLTWVGATLDAGRIGEWIARLPVPVLLVALPLALAAPLALTGAPWPAPEFYLPALWALLFFGAYFAAGFQLFHRRELLDRLRPWTWWLASGAVVAYAALFRLTAGFADRAPDPLYAWLEACTGLWMTLWCLLAARRWLDTANAPMRALAGAAYWIYLVHLPLLLAIQYPLLDVAWPWPVEFAIATAATFVLSYASYRWLVRDTLLGRLLDGRLRRSAPAAVRPARPPESAHR